MSFMKTAKMHRDEDDVESNPPVEVMTSETIELHDDFRVPIIASTLWEKLLDAGVELRGAEPIPREKRTDTQYLNTFTIFATSLTSLQPVSIGSVATLGFGLPLRDAALLVIFLHVLFILPAAYVITISPLTGMRQMIQSRYCFGKYGNVLTSIVCILMLGGFGIIGAVSGAEVLANIQPGALSTEVGLVIIMIIAMVIGFMGYRTLHIFTRWAWIPTLIALIILVGVTGDQLWQQKSSAPNYRQYMGMVALLAGNLISWANNCGDYSCYMPANSPRARVGFYCACGVILPSATLQILGAAIGGAIFAIPAWEATYQQSGLGGVIAMILVDRLGNFGKFILVILGLGVIATVAREIYSLSFNIVIVLPAVKRVPRVILAVLSTAVMVGVGIPASRSFVSSITAFLSIIGYYSGGSVTCYLIEYLWFRRGNPENLDPTIWDDGKALPSGLSAIAAMIASWGFIIPTMDQTWYTGPIAKFTGDLGFEVAIIVSAIVYIPLRTFEVKRRAVL